MAYRIRYRWIGKVLYGEKRRTGLGALTGAAFLLFLLLVHILWPEGMECLQELIRPVWSSGFAAVESFAEDLQHGGIVSDAAETFLRTLLIDDAVLAN